MIVYTIIVTYNGLHNEWIKKSLLSLKESQRSTKIIVVDNNSKDQTIAFIEQNYPEVTLIKNEHNVGFGKANNQGIDYALSNQADYVFLLNQDAYVLKDSLEKLIVIAEQNKSFGIISPVHLNGIGTSIETDFLSFASAPNTKNLINDAFLAKVEDKIYETNFVNAAAWLVSKNCLQILGGFSPSFYHYGEDNNYCHRAQFHKVSIGIYPFASVLHDRDVMPIEHADLGERMFKDQLVSWANPNIDNFKNPSVLRLFINHVYHKIIKNDKNVVKASKKLLKFKLFQSIVFKNNLNESKTANSFKFLNYKSQ